MPDHTIDLEHQGRPGHVAAQLLETEEGPVILDPGPGSTLARLEAALAQRGHRVADLRAVLLSHIHLDHAGATGLLTQANPRLSVYVHTVGAIHLADPTRLLASATRIYGDQMDRLWGQFLPVPRNQLRSLEGGETVTLGNRRFEVAYTPGHAIHHLSYFEPATGTAYLADTGGIRLAVFPHAFPVSPPPDFSLDDWLASIERILAWRPERLFVTHFGFSDDPARHLGQLRQGLLEWVSLAKVLLADPTIDDEERARAFEQRILASLTGRGPPEVVREYSEFSDFRSSWHGIARSLRGRP